MKNALRAVAMLAVAPLSLSTASESITEFEPQQNERLDWRIVNDGVMGGLSRGKVSFSRAGTMRFRGMLSLENNGGFSSVRTTDVKLDLSKSDGLVMRVRGDGRTYQLRLSTDARFRSSEIGFKADFSTTKGKWQEVRVSFRSLRGSWRGLQLPNEVFDPSKIERVTLLLGDKKPGPFKLEVDWVRTFVSQGSKTKSES